MSHLRQEASRKASEAFSFDGPEATVGHFVGPDPQHFPTGADQGVIAGLQPEVADLEPGPPVR